MEGRIYDLKVNSLYLASSIKIKGYLADFSGLHYYEEGGDLYGGNPYVTQRAKTNSEMGVSREIGNYDTNLERGVHLHFILPDIFLSNRGEDGYLPALNRWVVIRKRDGKQWLIESNYLGKTRDIISFHPNTLLPIKGTSGQNHLFEKEGKKYYQPFRYMGRHHDIENGKIPELDTAKENTWEYFYDTPLTSIGYGISSFSIYYPNSREVFGFYDAGGKEDDIYTVYGYYNEANDAYNQIINKELKEPNSPKINKGIEETLVKSKTFIFKSEINVSDGKKGGVNENIKYELALANTLPQAFNTLLAKELKSENPKEVERLLEQAEINSIESNNANPKIEYLIKRHDSSFDYDEGGTVWELILNDKNNALNRGAGAPEKDENQEQTTEDIYFQLLKKSQYKPLLESATEILQKLNELQIKYDDNIAKIDSLRYHLFVNWYKLALISNNKIGGDSIVPSEEDVRDYILDELINIDKKSESEGLKKIIEETGLLSLSPLLENETVDDFLKRIVIEEKGLALKIRDTAKSILEKINELNTKLATNVTYKSISFSIKIAPNGRWFQPTEPAIIFKKDGGEDFYPMFMEWEVGFKKIKDIKTKEDDVSKKEYFKDLIYQKFKLDSGKKELIPNADLGINDSPHLYQGLTMLTTHTGDIIKNDLERAKDSLLAKFPDESKNTPSVQKIIDLLNKSITLIKGKDDVAPLNSFGQVISGFNKALLMKELGIEMPIYDSTLFYYDEESYLSPILEMIGKSNVGHPNFDWEFNPFRSGILNLTSIHLTDSFGRSTSNIMDKSTLNLAYDLKSEINNTNSANDAFLSPRLLQPSRIETYWLNQSGREILNNIPTENPICGWVIANNLEDSLMIYATEGQLIGQVFKESGDVVFKNSFQKETPIITNPVLNNFVLQFINQKSDKLTYFDAMHDVINQSLEFIDPTSFSGFPQYALFANKPVAIVRSSIDLRSSDALSFNQAKTSIRQEINTKKGVSQKYENIEFPAQIGNTLMYDDGVIGYWKGKQPEDVFYAVVASTEKNKSPHDKISMKTATTELDWNDFPKLSLAGETKYLTLLMDPRAAMTVTTNMLPAETHQIPSIYFKKALDNLQITFDASIIITPQNKVHIPIMRDPSLKWKWWNKPDKNSINSLEQELTITEEMFNLGVKNQISDGAELSEELKNSMNTLWNLLIKKDPPVKVVNKESDEGILEGRKCLIPIPSTNKFRVDLSQLNLKGSSFELYQDLIRLVLENYSDGILPPMRYAHLKLQEIKDGWLQIDNIKS